MMSNILSRNGNPQRLARLVGAALGIAACAIVPARATPVFPESGYQIVYDLSVPSAGDYDVNSVPYSITNAASIPNGSFARVGYLLELEVGSGPIEYVAVSMNAFTPNASMLGVPTVASGELFNDVAVSDMDVESNVAGVATGSDLSTGYVQFWPNCYTYTGSKYATGRDVIQSGNPGCYGSMQIGNGIGNTVFAYNDFSNGGVADVGIGNAPSGNTDWTFAYNAPSYTLINLGVWVSVPEPSGMAILLGGMAALGTLRWRGSARV